MDETFFVGVYDPVDVRRNLLENSKSVVDSLQSFDKLTDIRKQKLKAFKEMKGKMKELDMLVSKLQEKLPKSHLRKAITDAAKYREENKHLDELDSALQKLEDEITSL